VTLTVRHSEALHEHLSTFEVDGATVASLLFEGGGRLSYPGRRVLEHTLGYTEPYTLEHESRIIEGLSRKVQSSIRMLANNVPFIVDLDPTLELLWISHSAWSQNGISLDRLVAALVAIRELEMTSHGSFKEHPDARLVLEQAAEVLVCSLHAHGFPPTHEGLEELFNGAAPACVGLGLVEL
jgi:hypothetical protein